MVAPIFYCVIVVLSDYVVNPNVYITTMVFIKGLPMDLCVELEYITTTLN